MTTTTAPRPPEVRPAKARAWVQTVLALVGLIGLPLVVYYLWLCVRYHQGALAWPGSWEELGDWLTLFPPPTLAAAAIFGAWLALQVVLQIAAPGRVREGLPLADGSRLKYRMNGLISFTFTLLVVGVAAAAGWLPPTLAYDHFGPLLTTVNLATFAFSLYLYVSGRAQGADAATAVVARSPDCATLLTEGLQQVQGDLRSGDVARSGDRATTGRVSGRAQGADAGTTGNFCYDYFMGVRLNPRIKDFDFKFFCESRPGLIAWVLINFSLAAKQYQLHGTVTVAMILVCAFHLLYIADYFWHEEAILSTWDIRHERFGWMLCWGDLVWVPFTYTLQAHYLVEHTHELPLWGTAAIVALNLTGYYLFRSANLQKHRFRNDPQALIWGKPPQYITTASGTRLLTSGWWGVARHVNYLGDLMMGLAWCLPCLFGSVVPYFYIGYFLILLIHRERRDHAQCLRKYGASWEEYCAQVRYRILPGVY